MTLVSARSHPDYDNPAGVRAAIESVLEPLGGMKAFVRSGQTVLLKPNFVRAMDPARGGVTHPVFIAEVARLARDAGASDVMVGDSPAFGSTMNTARRMNLLPLLDQAGGRVVEFRRVEKVNTPENGRFHTLSISGEALKADVLINLPKVKAHCQMVLTCATKNLYGCIPGRKKALMHCLVKNSRYLFGRMLVDNARSLDATLHLADGIIAMEGMGPTNGDPNNWGWILAGTDHTAMDRVVAAALGYDFDEVPHLKAARDMKAGETDLARIRIDGARIEDMSPESWRRADLLPVTFNPIRLGIGYLKHLGQWKTAA